MTNELSNVKIASTSVRDELRRSPADEYERHQTWDPHAREAVARYLSAGAPSRCLFLGCATGVNEVLPFARRAPAGTRILAGDIDEAYLRRLKEHLRRERLSNVEVRRIDITEDLSPLGGFDLVTLFFVIHRLDAWKGVIRRVAGLVGPGGRLCTSEFAGPGGAIYLSNEGGGGVRNAIGRVIRRYFELYPGRFEPELKSTSIGPVLRELGRLLRPAGHRDVPWRQSLTVGEMIEKIERRAYAPFWGSGRAPLALEQLRREFEWERSRRSTLVEKIRLYRFLRA
jgi:SAM-dependent methyltransferase